MPIAATLLLAALTAPALPELEELMLRYYQGAALALKENAICLKQSQTQWERARDRCPDAPCRQAAFLDRLAELNALQPGINLQRKLELPSLPALAWAIAPDTDPVTTPRVASRAFRAEGRLTYRGDTDSGYFLEVDEKVRYLLVGDMSLDPDSGLALPTLAKMNDRLSASGRIARDNRGAPYFDRRHCVFLHRLP